MKIVKIKKNEEQFLRALENELISSYLNKAHFDNKSSSLILMLEFGDLDKITDELTDILADKGVTDNEINAFGKQVDDLIGKFNPHV